MATVRALAAAAVAAALAATTVRAATAAAHPGPGADPGITIHGHVSPTPPSGTVTVTLQVHTGPAWTPVATKTVAVRPSGTYTVRFLRRSHPRCRVVVTYPGSTVPAPRTVTRPFAC